MKSKPALYRIRDREQELSGCCVRTVDEQASYVDGCAVWSVRGELSGSTNVIVFQHGVPIRRPRIM